MNGFQEGEWMDNDTIVYEQCQEGKRKEDRGDVAVVRTVPGGSEGGWIFSHSGQDKLLAA